MVGIPRLVAYAGCRVLSVGLRNAAGLHCTIRCSTPADDGQVRGVGGRSSLPAFGAGGRVALLDLKWRRACRRVAPVGSPDDWVRCWTHCKGVQFG
jgi:hypothetical protein